MLEYKSSFYLLSDLQTCVLWITLFNNLTVHFIDPSQLCFSSQHPIYATLEPPRRIGVTNPTYMNKYESGYSSGTAATIEYAIPSAINEYEIPN